VPGRADGQFHQRRCPRRLNPCHQQVFEILFDSSRKPARTCSPSPATPCAPTVFGQ
jgi:hypothetical protein